MLPENLASIYNGPTKLRAKATGEISMIDSYGEELIGSVRTGSLQAGTCSRTARCTSSALPLLGPVELDPFQFLPSCLCEMWVLQPIYGFRCAYTQCGTAP